MSKTINCVAIDIGASGGKVLVGSYDGSKLAITEIYRFLNSPVQIADHFYWDILYLVSEVKKGIQLAHSKFDGNLNSIGVDTWGIDYAFLDKHGELLANPFSYRDPRTNGMMEKTFLKMPQDEIFNRTGVQFMQFNTLFQLNAALETDPFALDAVGTFLMIPDLINYYLTGSRFCEFTNATTTQFFDPLTNNWNEPILEAMGFPRAIFPEIIEPGTAIGNLSPWVCEELGLSPIPVISIATHDTASAVCAVPTQEQDFAFLSSGTWSLLGAEIKAPIINSDCEEYNFSNYGGVCGNWLIWKNIQALWLLQECMRTWSVEGQEVTHQSIISKASQADAFGPVIDTDDLIFFTPGDFPSRIAEVCQRTEQKVPETQGEISRCILESLALKYRFVFERVQKIVGRPLDPIHTIGGGSRNELLNQFTADATGLNVVAGPAEASSIGNILMQLIALGQLNDLASSRRIVEESFEKIVFHGKKSDAWEESYSRYMEIISKSNTYYQ